MFYFFQSYTNDSWLIAEPLSFTSANDSVANHSIVDSYSTKSSFMGSSSYCQNSFHYEHQCAHSSKDIWLENQRSFVNRLPLESQNLANFLYDDSDFSFSEFEQNSTIASFDSLLCDDVSTSMDTNIDELPLASDNQDAISLSLDPGAKPCSTEKLPQIRRGIDYSLVESLDTCSSGQLNNKNCKPVSNEQLCFGTCFTTILKQLCFF